MDFNEHVSNLSRCEAASEEFEDCGTWRGEVELQFTGEVQTRDRICGQNNRRLNEPRLPKDVIISRSCVVLKIIC